MSINLDDGTRIVRLQNDRNDVRALTDLIKKDIDKDDVFNSCIRSYGSALSDTIIPYAEAMGAIIYRVANTEIILFEYNGICYNIASKSSINLDKGKSRDTYAELLKSENKNKIKISIHKIVGIDKKVVTTRVLSAVVVSAIVVWTKPRGDDAIDLAKNPLKKQKMIGYKEFFKIFNVDVTEEEYKRMIELVWKEEFQKKIDRIDFSPIDKYL